MKQINFCNWSFICLVVAVVVTIQYHDGLVSAAGEEQYSNSQPVDYNNDQERTPPPPSSFFDQQRRPPPPPPSCVTQLIPCLSYLYGVTSTTNRGSSSSSGSSTRTSSPNYFNSWNNNGNNNDEYNNDGNDNRNNNEDAQPPPRSCCDPLLSVIKSSPECLCTMISNEVTSKAGEVGINITRAQELPAKCGQIVNPIACLAIAAAAGNNNNRIMRSPSSAAAAASSTVGNIKYKLIIFIVSSWAAYMEP
ncbi:serum factor response D-like [Papaver somniferum]|uniref:serum factor response D-like n=1 Tax=Papaver somniferum TaxID=3469 RepID=UPI000E6F5065|nr:serum factor response D-like [Papaver somniferum]